MRAQTLQSASSAPRNRCATGFAFARPARPRVDVRFFPAKHLACYRRTLDWPAGCLEIESRAIVRAGTSGLPADRPPAARGCRLFACVTARRHLLRTATPPSCHSTPAAPAPLRTRRTMPVDRSRPAARARKSPPPARRPAGTFLPSAPCERGARAPANAPQRHRRLAVFRSDDFDREPRRAMAHAGIRFARRCGGHPVAPPPDMVRRRSIRARRGPCAGAATKPERSRSSDCQKAADYTGHDGREAHGTAQFLAEKRLPRVGRNRSETGARRPFPMRKRIIPHTQTLPPRSAHRRARFQRRQAPRAATKRLAA